MISHIRLKSGRTPSSSAEEISITPVTVFVGPNNSGKSKVLSEINHFCQSGNESVRRLLVDKITLSGMSREQAEQAISHITLTPNANESVPNEHIVVRRRGGNRESAHLPILLTELQNPPQDLRYLCIYFLEYYTLMLNGPNRINLVQSQQAGDLQNPSHPSSFQTLFLNNCKRAEVRRIVAEAFGEYFVIDPTQLGHLRIRLAPRPPNDEREERGIDTTAISFHASARLIEEASDGVKAFTGIITEVIAGDPRIILIDEPEAFLHPSLAFKLGFELSRASLQNEKRVFASTHSPNFVMGCIQSGAPINIIRLTYQRGVGTSRVLPSMEILELMRNPLLRSTGLLSALFYESVVVCESDTDRAFYQEINERLLRFKPDWGMPNCLFINAQNKQTIPTIIRPLRKLGIPAAGIVDVDVLKEGGGVWTNLLSGAYIPDSSHPSLAAHRTAIKQAMDRTGRDMKRDGGLAILLQGEKESAENLVGQLATYGVFAVSGGELESWLKPLGVTSLHGPAWLIKMFEIMGEDPSSPSYVKPSDNDVWEFLFTVKEWFVNPSRRGIPD